MTEKLPTNIKLRLLMLFIQMATYTSVFPFMAILLSDFLGINKAATILIIMAILKFIFSFFGGHLSDKLTYKKGALKFLNVLSITIFGTLSILVVYINNIYIFFFFTFLYLLSELLNSFTNPIYNAMSLDYINDNNRKIYSKYKYWITNFATALGMTIGGFLYINQKHILFLLITIGLVFNLTILFKINELPRKTSFKNINKIKDFINNYQKAINDKYYLSLIVGISLIMVAELSMASYVSVRLHGSFNSIALGDIQITGVIMYSILMTINTLVVVFFSFLILKLLRSFSIKSMLILGGFLYILGYSLIMSNNNFYTLIILIIIATIGEIIFATTYESEKIKMIPSDQRGSYSALDGLSSPISSTISRTILLLGGFLSPIYISVIIFIITSLGFSVLILTIFLSKNKK